MTQNTGPRHLKLGDEINGTVVRPAGGNRFVVTSKQVPRTWTIELHSTRPEEVQINEHTVFWVGRISPLKEEVLVYHGQYGRMPISDAMRPRYIASLQALLGESELTGEALGDARAMVDRIGHQNQADWLTVWRLLGEPGPGDTKLLLQEIDKLRSARKEAPDTLPELLEKLKETQGQRLGSALNRLVALA
jgi:hypothetical protein